MIQIQDNALLYYSKKKLNQHDHGILAKRLFQDNFTPQKWFFWVYPINGLQQYFEQMSVPVSSRPPHAETMRFEFVRVRSYWSFPSNIRVSPIAMARVGFYYTGKCAECRCFSCGKVYKEWRDGDDPYVIHQQISPSCFYMNGLESGNVPIHEEDRYKPRHQVDQILCGSVPPVNTARSAALAEAVEVPGISSTRISQIPVSNPLLVSTSTINNGGIPISTVNSGGTNTSTINNGGIPISTVNSGGTNTSTINNGSTPISTVSSGGTNTSSINNGGTNTSTSTSMTVGVEPSRSGVDTLGINFEKPRYPAYAVLTVRINTYNGWPTYLDQTPRDMAMAGFFYAGYGDYTRCFFCGGGLRNWEAGDDPWIEHARWFPKCAFLRQNQGVGFVNTIQARHQQAESTNELSQPPLNEGHPNNTMDSAMVLALREMGKNDTIINEAIDRWKNQKRREGIAIDETKMQATEIYEVILLIENERASGASAASSGQQLVQSVDAQTSSASSEVQASMSNGNIDRSQEQFEDLDKVIDEYNKYKKRLTCGICQDRPKAMAFLPCGHLYCCLDCAPAMRKCPVCNDLVKGTIKTFFP
ncbi:hypothetical protein [Endozoicomonas sp. Mp262]|uniref:RING-HC finger protein n=1 Tax=Endozoicomonas sp. Mp262 TaxID=2919499 RepID=UPI0021DA1C5C